MRLRPDDFPNNPYGEATNQAGHLLVGATVVSVGYWLGLSWGAVAIGLALGVAWELWHWVGLGGRGTDSRNDLAFYALGLAYPGAVWWPIVGLGLVGLHVWLRDG